MPRRVLDTLFERGEIARAFSYTVTIGATPDPAFIVALKKIPIQVMPLPSISRRNMLQRGTILFCGNRGAAQTRGQQKNVDVRKKKSLALHETRATLPRFVKGQRFTVASAFERSRGVAETAACGIRNRCAQRIERCSRRRHKATVFCASAPPPRAAQLAAELPLLATCVFDPVHTKAYAENMPLVLAARICFGNTRARDVGNTVAPCAGAHSPSDERR